MAVDIAIPRLGTFKTDAILTEWKTSEGGRVEKGDVVAGIETEKIAFDILAEASGFLHIYVKEGTACPVGLVVGTIAASRDELEALQKKPSPRPPPAIATINGSTTSSHLSSTERRKKSPISPLARKLAEEDRIDITGISGSGPGGRIVRGDIEKAIAERTTASAGQAPESAVARACLQGKHIKEILPLKGMRRVIAERMHQSLTESAQLSALGEIDMSQCLSLRKIFVEREDELGTRITYTDICVFIAARVLRDVPIVNSSMIDNEIKVWDDINIGVATAVENGLIAPVIRNADRKTLVEISKTNGALGDKARTGKLMPDDVSGGTFTITNLGSAGAGYRFETSIINPPESAILGIGGITDRAVVRHGQIVIRPIMTYGFTYDHRVIDGTRALDFMNKIIEFLENPGITMLTSREA